MYSCILFFLAIVIMILLDDNFIIMITFHIVFEQSRSVGYSLRYSNYSIVDYITAQNDKGTLRN